MPPNTIFISYSHQDEEWKYRLHQHLEALGMAECYEVWEDRQIEAGDDWFQKIQAAMSRAKLAILLVSIPFLNSKFIKSQEVPALLQQKKKAGLRIIPIILKPCPWKTREWLAIPQVRPVDGRPLAGFTHYEQEEQLLTIAEEIGRLFQRGDEFPSLQAEPEFPNVLPTPTQTNSRSALEQARAQKQNTAAPLIKKPIDYMDFIRCDLTKQVPPFLQHLSALGFHAFSHYGDFPMIEQYIAKRLEWELTKLYRREIQSRRLHMKPRAFLVDPSKALILMLVEEHGGCQLAEIFDQSDTDYFFLVEAQSVPPEELQRGAPQAWEELCKQVQDRLAAKRSRIIALWITPIGLTLEEFCLIPPLDRFDPDDVVVHFRGLLQDCGMPEDQRERLLKDLREYDGRLPTTYLVMEKMVKDLAQGVEK